MSIVISTSTPSSSASLVAGKYAIIGMVFKTVKPKNGSKEFQFWAPLVAMLDNNNGVTSLSVPNKSDFVTMQRPKIETKVGSDNNYRNNSGNVIEAIDAIMRANPTKYTDMLWFTEIARNCGKRPMNIEPQYFDSLSRNATKYTATVVKADFVDTTTKISFDASSVTEKAEKLGYKNVFENGVIKEQKLVLFTDEFFNTPQTFVDKDGNTLV